MADPIHALPPAAVYAALSTTPAGLSDGEARARLARFGPHRVDHGLRLRPRPIRLLLSLRLLPITLAAASVLASASGRPTLAACLALTVALTLAARYMLDAGATARLAAVRALVPPSAHVLRTHPAGTRGAAVPTTTLVPGDLLILTAGDRVPADARLVATWDCTISTAPLTADTRPRPRTAAAVTEPEVATADAPNIVLTGMQILSGGARAVVLATGAGSYLGALAHAVAPLDTRPSALMRELNQLSDWPAGLSVLGALFATLVAPERALSAASAWLVAGGLSTLLPLVTVRLSLALRAAPSLRARRLSALAALGQVTLHVRAWLPTLPFPNAHDGTHAVWFTHDAAVWALAEPHTQPVRIEPYPTAPPPAPASPAPAPTAAALPAAAPPAAAPLATTLPAAAPPAPAPTAAASPATAPPAPAPPATAPTAVPPTAAASPATTPTATAPPATAPPAPAPPATAGASRISGTPTFTVVAADWPLVAPAGPPRLLGHLTSAQLRHSIHAWQALGHGVLVHSPAHADLVARAVADADITYDARDGASTTCALSAPDGTTLAAAAQSSRTAIASLRRACVLVLAGLLPALVVLLPTLWGVPPLLDAGLLFLWRALAEAPAAFALATLPTPTTPGRRPLVTTRGPLITALVLGTLQAFFVLIIAIAPPENATSTTTSPRPQPTRARPTPAIPFSTTPTPTPTSKPGSATEIDTPSLPSQSANASGTWVVLLLSTLGATYALAAQAMQHARVPWPRLLRALGLATGILGGTLVLAFAVPPWAQALGLTTGAGLGAWLFGLSTLVLFPAGLLGLNTLEKGSHR